MRTAKIVRTTTETDIELRLDLDGAGKADINTGCGFLDHMLNLFAAHSRFDLSIRCRGDMEVDAHHTTEDVGLCLGHALKEALGGKEGIWRYGDMVLPMDEALVLCAVDLSGRSHLTYDIKLPSAKVGDFDTELAEEFFAALSRSAALTLHLRQLAGSNTHHILEAVFKACARALRQACAMDPGIGGQVPSTKGTLI